MFTIPKITEEAVYKFLSSLDPKKATGLDGISAHMLKISAYHITPIVTRICNISIKTNLFPQSWKLALVSPLFKSGSLDDPGNYRPISILPVLSKLLERHIFNHLYEFLVCNDLLSSRQSGFRSKHSCESALHLLTDEWFSHLYNGEMIGVMYIDFCKAFDMVDHRLLLEKLKIYNFSRDSINWFKSYLGERQQHTKFKEYVSPPLNIEFGVPQGSILGPLLFLIFINDLPLVKGLENLSLFADDATDFAPGPCVKKIQKSLQFSSNSVIGWCDENLMIPNNDKIKVQLLANVKKLEKMSDDDKILDVWLNHKKLKQVHE